MLPAFLPAGVLVLSAPSKRRLGSYYWSLPIVIAVVFLLAAKLVAIERAEVIEELSDRVAHRDPNDAAAAVRQLGEMPRPPLAVLVAAATASDRDVADEAQQTINRLLRRAQQKLESGRGAKSVSRQLTELARELADHRHAFPVADQAWLVLAAERILQLANQVPQKHFPAVATNCDLILTSIHTSPAAVAGPEGPRDSAGEPYPSNAETSAAVQAAQPNNRADDGGPVNAESADSILAPWRADWSRPKFRAPPASTEGSEDVEPSTVPPSPLPATPIELPADVQMLGRPLASTEVRGLLRKWQDTQGKDLTMADNEQLKQRGFDRLSLPLVQKLFSSSQDKLRLVDDVLKAPGVNPRPWLMLLADDPDAKVRLAAITVMATSNDAALVELAWQRAIHDRDPRVAALANRLRERREALQRR
jgi:hypothetical protein